MPFVHSLRLRQRKKILLLVLVFMKIPILISKQLSTEAHKGERLRETTVVEIPVSKKKQNKYFFSFFESICVVIKIIN